MRLLIVGPPGSGKSTLGQAIAGRFGLRFIDLDSYYWLPGWRTREDDEFRRLVATAIADSDGWVIAGNHLPVVNDLTWPAATMVASLDLPLTTTLPRVLVRAWRRSRSHEVLWGGNCERFWPQLLVWRRGAIINASIRTHRPRRKQLLELQRAPELAHLRWLHFASTDEARAWFALDAHSTAPEGTSPFAGPRLDSREAAEPRDSSAPPLPYAEGAPTPETA